MTGIYMTDEHYFVTSDGEQPLQVLLDLNSAKSTGAEYIDSFDTNGNKLASYKHTGGEQYTTDF